jgi:hypothetical protein
MQEDMHNEDHISDGSCSELSDIPEKPKRNNHKEGLFQEWRNFQNHKHRPVYEGAKHDYFGTRESYLARLGND